MPHPCEHKAHHRENDREDHRALLRAYVEQRDDAAFARLVDAYVGMVFSSAMRQTRNRDLAQEVTHVVFIVLARKAKSLHAEVVLSAWLHKTTRFTSLNVLKVQARRARHERKAAEMIPETPRVHSSWHKLSPLLDEAVARLGEKDRSAITLRYFERKTPAEVGREMGISEDAAAMRISRSVAKLRAYFKDRRIEVDAEMLGGMILANGITQVPTGLGGMVASSARAALHGGTAAGGTTDAGTTGAGTATNARTQSARASGTGTTTGVGNAMNAFTQSAMETADAVIRAMFYARAKAAAMLTMIVIAAMLIVGICTNELLLPLLHPHGTPRTEGHVIDVRNATMQQMQKRFTDRGKMLKMMNFKTALRA